MQAQLRDARLTLQQAQWNAQPPATTLCTAVASIQAAPEVDVHAGTGNASDVQPGGSASAGSKAEPRFKTAALGEGICSGAVTTGQRKPTDEEDLPPLRLGLAQSIAESLGL